MPGLSRGLKPPEGATLLGANESLRVLVRATAHCVAPFGGLGTKIVGNRTPPAHAGGKKTATPPGLRPRYMVQLPSVPQR
jgi:hypothetical protein